MHVVHIHVDSIIPSAPRPPPPPPSPRPLGHVVFLGSFNGTVAQTVRPRPWLIFIFRINEDRPYQRVTQRLSLESNMFLTCSTPLQVGHYHLHLRKPLSLSLSLSHFPLHYRCTLRSFLFSLFTSFFFFIFALYFHTMRCAQENYEICTFIDPFKWNLFFRKIQLIKRIIILFIYIYYCVYSVTKQVFDKLYIILAAFFPLCFPLNFFLLFLFPRTWCKH